MLSTLVRSQIVPPYLNKFDQNSDTVGWKHYASVGSDDWEWGVPLAMYGPFSSPKAWATKLLSDATLNSTMYLQSPSFDLSNTLINWRLNFAHRWYMSTASGANVEYSIDNGVTWTLLDGPAIDKSGWYTYTTTPCTGNPAFSLFGSSNYAFSLHNLLFLSGQPNVKFRFKFCNGAGPSYYGWIIDNFYIEENKPNVFPYNLTLNKVSKNCPKVNVSNGIAYYNLGTPTVANATNFYLSNNNILDASDLLINTVTNTLSSNYAAINFTFNLPAAYQSAGTKYMFVKVDAGNTINESNELDNVLMQTLLVDSIYSVPMLTNFETGPTWTTNNPTKWVVGSGTEYQFENAHSGANAFGNLFNLNVYQSNYIESPIFDNKNIDSTVISFWYRSKIALSNIVQYTQGCPTNSTTGNIGGIITPPTNKWAHVTNFFPQGIDTSRYASIRIINGIDNAYFPNNFYSHDLLIDDIYIGKVKADISMEGDLWNRYSPSNDLTDTLKYNLVNCGLNSTNSFSTAFYWSTDSILNAGDVFLALKPESAMSASSSVMSSLIYTKPTTTPGKYYILYNLDSTAAVNEMREYNNKGYFIVYQDFKQSIPYFNDFETQTNGWHHSSSFGKDEWKLVTPNKPAINYAFSGTKAWVSNDTGVLSPHSRMHLYTPIFDLNASVKPVLEFSMLAPSILNTSFPAIMNMSYSTDNGLTWTVLDTASNSLNRWYLKMGYDPVGGIDGTATGDVSGNFFKFSEPIFVTSIDYNGRDCKRIYKYILDIKRFAGVKKIQFRFNLASDQTNLLYPSLGVMIDDFMIREGFSDLFFDYKKSLMISSNTQRIKFNGQVKNRGNFVVKPGTLNFYLSTDTIIDSGDHTLGSDNYGYVRPDNYYYFNKIFFAPSNLSSYKYLLIKADVNNTTLEFDENNNEVAWSLALDSIKNTSYSNNFNDSVVNGWSGYAMYNSNLTGHRLRNQVPPAGSPYLFRYRSGELFTDQVAEGNWNPMPTFYVESPKFDFGGCKDIFVGFKMMCTGAPNTNGGIIEYSTDGGNNFNYLNLYTSILTPYNYSLSVFGNFGWAGQIGVNPNMVFTPVKFDATFLAGQKDVVFRFKYASNHYFSSGDPHGLRIDDFYTNITKIDYTSNDPGNTILVTNSNTINIGYHYSINEPFFTPPNQIKFYWSADVLLDNTDQLISTVPIASATGPVNYIDSINIDLNALGFNNSAYLIYMLDRDSTFNESNENNNIGKFYLTNGVGVKENTDRFVKAYIYNSQLNLNVENTNGENKFAFKINDISGKLISQFESNLKNGNNIIELPQNVSKGMYLITITNRSLKYTKTLKFTID